MQHFLNRVKHVRSDISDWVVHYTQGTPEIALDNLKSILKSGLKNNGTGLCFTESPITEFSRIFEIFKSYPTPRFAPYGIAVRKDWLFALGGRPVIYLPADEKVHLSKEISHLFEEFEPGKRDFTWLREWRSNLASLKLTRDNTIVIIPSEAEAEGFLYDWDLDVEYEGPDEYSYNGFKDIYWYYISLDSIKYYPRSAIGDEVIIKLMEEKSLGD